MADRIKAAERASLRTDIIRAATRLFAQHGYEKVSIIEVMGAVGKTHGAFYKYFASKHELLLAALDQQTSELLTAASMSALAEGLVARSGTNGDGWLLASLNIGGDRNLQPISLALSDHARRLEAHMQKLAADCGPERAFEIVMSLLGAFQLLRLQPDAKMRILAALAKIVGGI